MSITRNMGIMLIGGGVIILALGCSAPQSVADRMSTIFAPDFTESTTWFIILGTAYTFAGGLFAIFGGKKPIS